MEAFRETHLIKFFVVMRGARTPPPRIEEPVTNIPLQKEIGTLSTVRHSLLNSIHAPCST
jgi:hypothetical protein